MIEDGILVGYMQDDTNAHPMGTQSTGHGRRERYASMIGNDTALDSGVGVCGKDGQSVPVGVGQPTLRIDAGLTVGGSEI